MASQDENKVPALIDKFKRRNEWEDRLIVEREKNEKRVKAVEFEAATAFSAEFPTLIS